MKISHTLKSMIAVLSVSWCSCFGQNEDPQNSSASAVTRYEGYAVDNSTGMPGISVPLYTMPTRSKDINLDLSVNYHASTVADVDKTSGDCGRGWSLSSGVITRSIIYAPDEASWEKGTGKLSLTGHDIYQFNFMGYSGKFILDYLGPGLVTAKLFESEGETINIIVKYRESTHTIDSFIIYDSKGYSYEFTTFDSFGYTSPPDIEEHEDIEPGRSFVCKTAFHLDKIYDRNYELLAEFTHSLRFVNGVNRTTHLIKAKSYGYGEMEFFDGDYLGGPILRYRKIEIKDYNGKKIKSFDFDNLNAYQGPNVDRQLKDIIENDSEGNPVQSYKFEYKRMLVNSYENPEVDKWGYNARSFGSCFYDGMSHPYSLNGVLQKMILPTGGCVIYDFEQNNFSYNHNTPLESVSTNPNFYTLLSDGTFATSMVGIRNLHNYEIENMGAVALTGSGTSNIGVLPYLEPIPFTTKYFLKVTGEPYTIPGTPFPNNPSFTTMNMDNSPVTTYDSSDNYRLGEFCLGAQIGAGQMKIKLNAHSVSTATGYATVYRRTAKPLSEVKKWWYGGGIRIKSIAYYAENQDINALPEPARKITYDYTFFNEPNRSSGSCLYGSLYQQNSNFSFFRRGLAPVMYQNVTVKDTKDGGRTEYTYHTPINSEGSSNLLLGKLKQQKIFNEIGTLLREVNYNYITKDVEYTPSDFEQYSTPNGWIGLKDVNIKNYVGQDMVESKTSYTYYDESYLIDTETSSSGIASGNIMTKYTYMPITYNTYGYVPIKVEKYRDAELLSKSESTYHMVSIPAPPPFENIPTPSYYLPATMGGAKGNNASEINLRLNKYDTYNHLLESEQENGIKTAYIWGYNNTQIIAKIEGIGYDEIALQNQALITAAQVASDDAPTFAVTQLQKEDILRSKLLNLRNAPQLSQTMMTSYTYIPLVGVSTITDARGRMIRYEYDKAGRLQTVKDHEGNILTETLYHTKPQN